METQGHIRHADTPDANLFCVSSLLKQFVLLIWICPACQAAKHLAAAGILRLFPDIRMIGNMSEGRFFVHDGAAAKRQLCRRRDSLPAILPPILGKLAGIAKLLPAADFAAGYPAVHNFADFARLVILRLIKRMRQTFPVNLQSTDLVLLERLEPCVDAPRQRILLTIILLLFAQRVFIRLGQVRAVRAGLVLHHDFRPKLLEIVPGLRRIVENMAVGFRRIHRHREKAPIAASVQRQEIHAVGRAGKHALPGMIAAVSVVCHPQKILVAAEKRLDILDAFGVRRRDHLRKFANPMPVEPMINLLVVQFADIVREPFRLQRKEADEGGFARALPAHQHQHQLKLAAGMKHPVHRAEHERAQVLFVRVAHFRAKKMVQRHPDARHAIPDEAVQPVPHRMEPLRGGHDVQRRINQLFRPQPVVFFQIQPQERNIHVVNHVAFPRPPDGAGHRHAFLGKYSRYQMFAKDGKFSSAFEKLAWDENDAAFKRMKICVCCAETRSIKTRLEEIKKELDKCPYKLGLLIVTVKDEAQYKSIQKDLEDTAANSGEPRLIIALVKTPFTDEKRKQWLTNITKQELASSSVKTAAASQYENDARIIVSTWVNEAVSVSNIIAWNEKNVFTNQFGMLNLRKTIRMNVQDVLFPYAPETIVVTSTAYKPCNDPAPLAGITRATTNSQLKNVLDGLKQPGLLSLNTINSMVDANGSKQATSVSALAKLIRDEMESGQKVVLSDLWAKLQAAPFGYYNCIACGVLLGYVFSCYKNSTFNWTDNVQSTHDLGDATLKTLILNMVKGIMTTDYLSAGSVTFQQFRQYAKYILNLSDAEIANETACWHNMREAVTKTGSPFWALKYLPDAVYGSPDFKLVAMKIIDNMQEFIAAENNSEGAMSNVIQLFNGRGKLRVNLTKAFQDKNVMAVAFRTFLFDASPELKAIADKLSVTPEALSDKLHMVMQNAIYTWTEEQVKGKLPDIVSEYGYLDALNSALEKVYHSTEDAVKDLANLFKFLRISMAAIAKLDKPWFAAMQILYKVSYNGILHMTQEERAADIAVLTQYGKNAMDCLKDARPVLADILESEDIDCTQQELDSIYAGLKDMTCDTSLSQFEKELKTQIGRISQVRNRALLQERWLSLTGKESVKAWCSDHSAPLLWIIPKEFKKDFVTLIDVQKNNRVLDQSVQNAINTLSTMDAAILNDSAKINDAFMKIIGIEYASLFQECGPVILAQAKMRIGNDMSAWDTSDLPTLLGLLKNAQKEKAKKEKLAGAKKKAAVMPESDLRSRVVQFLDEHPEFCDFFAK